MSEPTAPRIGHAERDAAVERLREAAAEGRIDLDELEERVETALHARTQPELDALLADLPPTDSRAGPPATRGQAAVALQQPGYAAHDPLLLSAGSGSTTRTGRWELPGWVRLSPALGTVRVDCREASTRYSVIDVEVVPSAGTAVVVLPEGWAADVDRVGRGIGSVTSTVAMQPQPGAPLLVLRGSVGLGTVKVRHATWWERWRASRAAARG